jgi:hypothetical protein
MQNEHIYIHTSDVIENILYSMTNLYFRLNLAVFRLSSESLKVFALMIDVCVCLNESKAWHTITISQGIHHEFIHPLYIHTLSLDHRI